MIIECQACRARFKLDEHRIKGRGARIRCRKCGESIIVMKSGIDAAEPSAPVGNEPLDLRSILREPERVVAPSREKIDAAFEKPSRKGEVPESAPREPAEPTLGTAPGLGEEIDAAFDRMIDRDRERQSVAREPGVPHAEVPSPPPEEIGDPFVSPPVQEQASEPEHPVVAEEAPAPAEPEPEPREPAEPFAEVSFPSSREVDDSFDTPLFGELSPHLPPETGEPFAGDLREPTGKDALVATPPEEEEPDTGQKPVEFLILDSDTPDFLGKDRAPKEQGRPFDISENLSQTPQWTLEEETIPAPPAPEPASPLGGSTDLRAETIRDELAGLAGADLQEEGFSPEPSLTDLPPPRPPEMESRPVMPPPLATEPSRRPSINLLALLFLALAAGGAFLAFTKTGQETLRSFLGDGDSVHPFRVENPIGFYETGKDVTKLFVIKGAVVNQGPSPKSGIRVRAELLDVNQKKISELTAYAGNVIPVLHSENREAIETAMSNRFGRKLSNVDVAPGKSVPFMVVFVDPPEGIEEYRLQALEGE